MKHSDVFENVKIQINFVSFFAQEKLVEFSRKLLGIFEVTAYDSR